MKQKPVETILKEKKLYQIINLKLIQAAPELPVKDALKLMQDEKTGYVVIAKNKKVIGIFTEKKVVRKVLDCNIDMNTPVSEFMTKDPLCLSPKDSIGKAIELMGRYRFYHIPLVNEKKELEGVISVRTLIRFLAEFYPTEVYNLPPNPELLMDTPEGG